MNDEKGRKMGIQEINTVMKKVKDYEKTVGYQMEIIIQSSGMIEVRPESIIGNGSNFFGIDAELLCYELELHMRIIKYHG